MAFPDNIVTFPEMKDVTVSDGALVTAFQQAMEQQDIATARAILLSIPDYDKKFITANLWNNILDLCEDLERYYLQRYSPAYIVSPTQPLIQEKGDFWFQVIE